MQPVLDDATEAILRSNGWSGTPHETAYVKSVAQEFPEFEMSPAAQHALTWFGGLRVPSGRRGVDHAAVGFCLDPLLLKGEDSIEGWIDKEMGSTFPLGEADHDGQPMLGILPSGSVIAWGTGEIREIGTTVENAISNLVHGRRWRTLWRRSAPPR